MQGTIRINQRSYEDAYVSSPDDANLPDIYVGGLKDRNRALHGDEVFVMVEDKSRWKVLADRIRDYLEAKEDGKGKGSLTAEDVALKMSALKFRKDEQAEVQINKGYVTCSCAVKNDRPMIITIYTHAQNCRGKLCCPSAVFLAITRSGLDN